MNGSAVHRGPTVPTGAAQSTHSPQLSHGEYFSSVTEAPNSDRRASTGGLHFYNDIGGPTFNRHHAGEFRHAGHGGHRKRRSLILCFDGTGNKFKGNAGDTNILKIFRMLDRNGGDQFHYYQPGIGTYITNGTLSRVHIGSRIKSWYKKGLDAAVGTSFDEHVIGGYRFLMRFYAPGDDIYMFGFSRGAYTARFLSEMLDHIGLVSQGNEEMIMFAWKTFSNWQQRQSDDRKQEMYNYMRAFRETFARPVRRVRFLGLFDTVNSVPRFEQAWLKRSGGFPYTARSSARVIRHAVGIDERRAKFRQDLIEKVDRSELAHRRRSWKIKKKQEEAKKEAKSTLNRIFSIKGSKNNSKLKVPSPAGGNQRFSAPTRKSHESVRSGGEVERVSIMGNSMASLSMYGEDDDDSSEDDDENGEQDIEEVWFPGAHGDIGGGWDLPSDEEPLSHGPLVWMVREARRAGVKFDPERMKELNCWIDGFEDEFHPSSPHTAQTLHYNAIPSIQVTGTSPSSSEGYNGNTEKPNTLLPESMQGSHAPPPENAPSALVHSSREYLERSYIHGKIHDCLLFNNGLGHIAVLGWKIMEYLPFRRMDLQPDGTWKPIIWPLPCGEVRDVPDNIKVHCSVLKRMQADEKYRPGNLLVGGGGRGLRKAPKHVGTGDWVVVKAPGDPVGELYMKKSAWEEMMAKRQEHENGLCEVHNGMSDGAGKRRQSERSNGKPEKMG